MQSYLLRSPLWKGLLIVFIIYLPLKSQDIPIGTWRAHPGFNRFITAAPWEGGLLVMAGDGLFHFNPADGETRLLGKEQGLRGGAFTALSILPDGRALIGYSDGALDFLTLHKATNFGGLQGAYESFAINDIALHGGQSAYLAMPFGLLWFDWQHLKVKETYAGVGGGAANVGVSAVDIFNDTIYCLTNQGAIRRAAVNNRLNKQDPANWSGFADAKGPFSLTTNGFGYYFFLNQNQDTLWGYQQGGFSFMALKDGRTYHSMDARDGRIWLGAERGMEEIEWSARRSVFTSLPSVLEPRQSLLLEGNSWVLDAFLGLIPQNGLGQGTGIAPWGPSAVPLPESLRWEGGRLHALPVKERNGINGISVFHDGQWDNYSADASARGAKALPSIAPIAALAHIPNENAAWAGSFGSGLWKIDWAEGRMEEAQNALLNHAADGGVYISSILFSKKDGLLWVSFYNPQNTAFTLSSMTADGQWQRHESGFATGRYSVGMLEDAAGNKWLRADPAKGGGLSVWNADGKYKRLDTSVSGGQLRSDNIHSMAFDNNGSLWLGSDDGVMRIDYPENALSGQVVEAFVPIYETGRLMAEQQINAIAIDGGNRKWFGTSKGAWLFNEDCTRLLAHYDASNSLLPANSVLSIAVDGKSGEVFFATSAGMASYRAAANEAAADYSAVKIFPNPVPASYEGLLSIVGLKHGSEVKITDASGRLVYETLSDGGTAVWDLRRYEGGRASSGLYWVYVSDAWGETGIAGKFWMW